MQRQSGEGKEGVSGLDEAEALVAMEFLLSRMSPALTVASVPGQVREGGASQVDEGKSAGMDQI